MSSVYLGWGKSVFCEITRVDDGQLLLIIVVVKSVSSLSLNSFPVFFLLAFVVSLIGVDDACDELVTDNIFLGKFYDGNTFYSFQYLQGFLQSTFALFWQVDLCHITCDDHLRVPSHAGEKHSDLCRRGVLCLVEDDNGIAQCTAARRREARFV